MNKNVYEEDGGFVFEIINDEGKIIAYQEFNPRIEGFVRMSETEANALADEMIAGFSNPVVIPEPAEPTPPKSQLEILQETVDMLVLNALEG